MKKKLKYSILVFLLFGSCSFFVRNNNKGGITNTPCGLNTDTAYNRVVILQKLADVLNQSVPEFEKGGFTDGFTIRNGRCSKFCLYDLVDTLNIDMGIQEEEHCIEMINNHIYHFVPILEGYSYSHIAILMNGNIKIFYSVNCESRGGNNITDVLKEVDLLYANHPKKDYVLQQVKNYRQYRIYSQIDPEGAFVCR